MNKLLVFTLALSKRLGFLMAFVSLEIGDYSIVSAQNTTVDVPGIVWGVDTNGFRAGISSDQGEQAVSVYVITSKAHSGASYFRPPMIKSEKVQLKNMEGSVISPVIQRKITGVLPKQLPLNAFRKVERGKGGYYYPDNLNLYSTNVLRKIDEFTIHDAYFIEKEGDYSLTVWPIIYEWSDEASTVYRIDIAPVTTQLHLLKSLRRAHLDDRIPGYAKWVCVAGACVWLIFSRRYSRQPVAMRVPPI